MVLYHYDAKKATEDASVEIFFLSTSVFFVTCSELSELKLHNKGATSVKDGASF